MPGLSRLVLAVLCMLIVAHLSDAFGGRFAFWRSSFSYRPPATAYYYAYPAIPYCPPMPTAMPVPDAPRMKYAQPFPAPPSSSNEPPLQEKREMPPVKNVNEPPRPVIAASHVASSNPVEKKAPAATERVRVGFWNLTGRDIVVIIDGQARTIAKDRALNLNLPREFAWQLQDRPPHVERVALGNRTHEVVIRD